MAKAPCAFVEIDVGDLEFLERLGAGSSGTVYRGVWKSQDKDVAIKKLLILEKEAKVLSSLSHRNIVQFFGAVTKAPNYCIVTEYAELGSVHDYLQKNSLQYTELLQWARQIAAGMHYLHYEAPHPVIHRDLKSSNVVIKADMTVKICDFGSSKFHQHTTKLSLAGTFSWMAPEVIQQQEVTIACDVYSYSVVLWELLTHQVPFKGLEGLQVAWLVVAKGERLTIPSSCPVPFERLMRQCWETEPKNRLTFKQVLQQLDQLLGNSSLKNEMDSFLKRKEEWKEEIESRVSELKKIEKTLSNKERELTARERVVKAREKELEQRSKNAQSHEEHNVSTWSEDDVIDWLQRISSHSSTTFASYSEQFGLNHINGRCLLLLTSDDLLMMGVLSVGHRRELMKEIEVLRQDNHRLLHFPPLSTSNSSSKLLPGQQENSDTPSASVSVNREPLTVVFANLCRKGNTNLEHKWKFLVDLEGSPQAVLCVKEVLLVFSSGETITMSRQPFVMDNWRVGPNPGLVEIILRYKGKVKDPLLTKYSFLPKQEGHVEELRVLLELKPPIPTNMAETPSNPDDASLGPDQWDIVSPMPGQVVPLGIWGQRTEFPGTPLEPREDGSHVTPGGGGVGWGGGFDSPALGRLSLSATREDSAKSPPMESSYRGPPLQGAWAKPLGLVAAKDCCAPRGTLSFSPAAPPTTTTPTVQVAVHGSTGTMGVSPGGNTSYTSAGMAPRGTAPYTPTTRQMSHQPIGAGVGASAQTSAWDMARRQRHGSMQEAAAAHCMGDGDSGGRRPSHPAAALRGAQYLRSESDTTTATGQPMFGNHGNQRKNTSEPPPSRTQSWQEVKAHRVKR